MQEKNILQHNKLRYASLNVETKTAWDSNLEN